MQLLLSTYFSLFAQIFCHMPDQIRPSIKRLNKIQTILITLFINQDFSIHVDSVMLSIFEVFSESDDPYCYTWLHKDQ